MVHACLCVLVLVCSLSEAVSSQCIESSYHRRYEFDNYIFPDATILFDGVVENRADCVTKCQRTSLCNQAIYHGVTNRCILHSDTVWSETNGTYDTGWQYYGASCDIYRRNNSISSANIQTSADDVCDVGYHALITCMPTSCYSGGAWTDFAVKCTRTLFAQPFVEGGHIFTLDFDLKPGHVISLQVTSDLLGSDWVELMDGTGNFHFYLRLRWLTTHAECIAASYTHSSGWEEIQRESCFGQYIENHSNYTIDIHIMDNAVKAYGNGHLLIANNMSIPFTGVRIIWISGISAVLRLKVGEDICP